MHAGATNDDFGAEFVKEGGGFKGALAGTDDDYSLVRKPREIPPLGSVRSERRGDLVKRSRTRGESRDAAGNDDARSDEIAAVLECAFEFSSVELDGAHFPRIHVGHGGTLIPQAIVNEALENNRGS